MANISVKIKKFLENRILILSLVAFVAALSCVLIFAGNGSEDVDDVAVEPVVEASSEADPTVRSGYGIYVDGYFVAASDSLDEAKTVVNAALDSRASALGIDAQLKNSFKNKIDFVNGDYAVEAYVENISSLLGDAVYDYSGAQLPVGLSVLSVASYSENVVLEYETKTTYTDAMSEGTKKVEQEGFNGEGVQTYEIVYVDGVETERNAVSLEVTTEPVEEELLIGTKTEGKYFASVANFVKPYDGIISSWYGYRWGTLHKGLDICQNGGCFKDPAYAAYGGVVINARNSNNGYGNCVIIDHGNGLTTLYAHFHSLCVEEGDIVEAGDVVGLIGSTGYSFGPHLHFEVRIDNVPVDPSLFVHYEN